MSSKRSQWSEFDKDERKYIKKRDKERCVICGASGALQIMHIFVNRANGGKGERRNGCLGCVQCHRVMDNPIGEAQCELAKAHLAKCKAYLIDVEHIECSERELCDQLRFSKERDLPPVTITMQPIVPQRPEHKCADCAFCVRNRRSNSTVPSYFCKRHYCIARKSAPACAQFEERSATQYESRRTNYSTHK